MVQSSARTVREELLHQVIMKAINNVFRDREAILPILRKNIEKGLENNLLDQILDIDTQIRSKQQELLDTMSPKNGGDELGMEIRRLRAEKLDLQSVQASRHDLGARTQEMMCFLNDLTCELTYYKDHYVRTLVEKFTVCDNQFIVEFKSGLEVQIDN